MSATILAPAPGSDPAPEVTAKLAAVLDDLTEHLGYEEPQEALDDLLGRWAVVVDALSGIPGVTPHRLRYDLYCLADVLRRLRVAIPAEDYPW